MFDLIFTLLSFQFILCVCVFVCVYIYAHTLCCIEQPIFPNKFYIQLSMDECWIGKMYMCVYVCVPHCILGIHAVQYSAVCSSILKLLAAI